MNRSRLAAGFLAAAAMTAVMPGCIVQDIYEQIELTNATLQDVNEKLAELEEINTHLAHLQTVLDEQQQRLAVLATIDVSLKSLDETLADLSGVVKSIDNAVPFLSFGSDDDEEEAGEDGETPEGGVDPMADDPEADPEAQAGDPR